MERDENGPYHDRDQVPEELFIEQEVFYAQCTTCGWHSDFVEDRNMAVSDAWRHEYEMENSLCIPHNTIQMKATIIYQRDLPDEGEPELP